MKLITINRSAWHARFYRRMHGKWSTPDNLCPYFWGLVLAIATLPLTWWSLGDRDTDLSDRIVSGIIGHLCALIFLGLAIMVGAETLGLDGPSRLALIVGVGVLVGGLLVAIALCVLAVSAWGMLSDRRTRSNDSPGLVRLARHKVVAWYKGVCPRIDWRDDA